MSALAATMLTIAAEAFIDTLVKNLAGGLYDRLKGDPARKAYKRALGAAIDRYASGERLPLARPLLDRKGILADKEVTAELTQLLRFEREPNLELIGQKWKAALPTAPGSTDFAGEARLLITYLEEELRRSEVFRPVFEARDLGRIATDAGEAAEALADIEAQLEGLADLLDARLGALLEEVALTTPGIRDQVRDFSRYIEEKTRGFVGRQWVFDEIERFMQAKPRGYFFVLGDPGIGKSALAAQMVKQHGYIHHFNIRAEGISKADTFLTNVCAQLVAAYDLPYAALPPEATADAGFLNKLLGEVSGKLNQGERCVIVVDALDEVDRIGLPKGMNLLYLPLTIPQGVFFVVTLRDEPEIKPRVDCEQDELLIKNDSSSNLADVTDFVQATTARPGIRSYIQAQKLDAQEFVDMMVRKSEGNFMYLRYVLPEVERGAYKDRALKDIPAGLVSYYEDHWRRMRGEDEDAWFEYKLPVLVALSVVQKPVSIDLISDFSKVTDRRRIRAVLREWAPFLHEEEVEYEGGRQQRYRLYHTSFFEFIANKQEIADERVDLKAMHGQIADTLWDDLGLS